MSNGSTGGLSLRNFFYYANTTCSDFHIKCMLRNYKRQSTKTSKASNLNKKGGSSFPATSRCYSPPKARLEGFGSRVERRVVFTSLRSLCRFRGLAPVAVLLRALVLRVLVSCMLAPINSLLPYSPLLSPTIPTFDIMSSSNNIRPSLYVSTTPVDQEGDVPVTWNMMRNNVQPMLLEVSGVFQQSMLIVS